MISLQIAVLERMKKEERVKMKPMISIDKVRFLAKIRRYNAERMLNYLEALQSMHFIDRNIKIKDGKGFGTIFGKTDPITGVKHGAIYFRITLVKEHATGEVLPNTASEIDIRDLLEDDGRPGWAYMLACYAEAMKRKEMATTLHQFLRLELEYNPNHFKKTPLMEETVNTLLGFTDTNTITPSRIDIALDFYEDIINGQKVFDQVPNRTCATYSVGDKSTGWLIGRNGNNVQISIYDKNKEREDNKQTQDIKHPNWNRVEVRLSRSDNVVKNLKNWAEFNPFEKCNLVPDRQCGLAEIIDLIPEPKSWDNKNEVSKYDSSVTAITLYATNIARFESRYASKATRAKYKKLYHQLEAQALAGANGVDLFGAFESVKEKAMTELLEILPWLKNNFEI